MFLFSCCEIQSWLLRLLWFCTRARAHIPFQLFNRNVFFLFPFFYAYFRGSREGQNTDTITCRTFSFVYWETKCLEICMGVSTLYNISVHTILVLVFLCYLFFETASWWFLFVDKFDHRQKCLRKVGRLFWNSKCTKKMFFITRIGFRNIWTFVKWKQRFGQIFIITILNFGVFFLVFQRTNLISCSTIKQTHTKYG